MGLADVAILVVGLLGTCGLLLATSWLIARWPALRLPLLAVPGAIGLWFARSALNAPLGYVAAYDFGGAWVVASALALAGCLLVAPRPSRRAGVAGFVASATLLLVFYSTYLAGYGLGLHAWRTKAQTEVPAAGTP